MFAPLAGDLVCTQLFASKRGGSGERYTTFHDGIEYTCIGHAGIDFNCAVGTPVLAMKGGTLLIPAQDRFLGIYAVIRLDSGEEHTYAHLSQITAKGGSVLTAGESFALSGATGNVTGPHLHAAVRPPNPFYANGFDGYIDFITHFNADIYPIIVLDLV